MKKLILILSFILVTYSFSEATDYYVATSGGGTTCSSGSPCLTIAMGISKLASGDRLIISGGTYDERIDATLIPNGTSDTNRTRIHVASGETVIIMPTSVSGVPLLEFGSTRNWIEFDGGQNCGATSNGAACRLIFDATNVVSPDDSNTAVGASLNASTNLRFKNFEMRNAGVQGGTVGNPENGFAGGTGGNVELINCNIHDNGKKANAIWTAGAYGWYISGGSGHVVDNCLVHNNGGYGIHAYSGGNPSAITGAVIKNSKIYANGQANVTISIANVLLSSCTGCVIYNSEVRHHLNLGGGIEIGTGCSGCKVYSNTVYQNTRYGIGVAAGASGTIIRNNIIKDNNLSNQGWPNLDDNGLATTRSNNLCHGMGGTTLCNLTSDPLFAGTGGGGTDFRLLETSPAKDAGITLEGGIAPYNTDLLGTTRPQPAGGLYDLGAYEFGTPTAACPMTPRLLAAQYTFNSVATDSAGNGAGTATLGTGVTYVAGKIGNGLGFTGAGGATVADADILDMCDGFSLMAWINVPDTTTDRMFIVKNPNSKYFLGMLSGYCSAGAALVGGYSQGDTTTIACDSTLLTTSVLTHVAVTYDGTTVRLYKNGFERATAAGGATLDATTGTLQFCDSSFSEFCPNASVLDEAKLYSYGRSAAEVITDTGVMSRTVKVGLGKTLMLGSQ